MFLSKEERAALAIQRRQEAIQAQRKLASEELRAHQKFLEGATSTRRSGRWEEESDRNRQREETLTEKDKQKEMEAIKVGGSISEELIVLPTYSWPACIGSLPRDGKEAKENASFS